MKTIIFGGLSYTDYYERAESYAEAYEKAVCEAGEPLVCVVCVHDRVDLDIPQHEEQAAALMEQLDREAAR